MSTTVQTPIEVTNTHTTSESIIEFRPGEEEQVKQNVEDILQRFSEIVAKECGVDISQIKDCMPQNIVFKEVKKEPTKRAKKEKKININNWETAEKMTDLSSLKGSDLKDILKSNNMTSSGSKAKLIERVWSINHPGDVELPPVKKRGRPKGTTKASKKDKLSHSIIEDSDSDTQCNDGSESNEDIENLLQNATETKMKDGRVMHVVVSKKWVFSVDDEGDYEWEGTLNDDCETITECNPPEDLMKLYAEE